MKRYYLLLTLSILSFPLRAAESISNCDEGLPHTSTGFLGETDEKIPLPPHLKNKWWEVLEGTDICALEAMLTQFSIDLNEKNKDGRTPLHITAAKGIQICARC